MGSTQKVARAAIKADIQQKRSLPANDTDAPRSKRACNTTIPAAQSTTDSPDNFNLYDIMYPIICGANNSEK